MLSCRVAQKTRQQVARKNSFDEEEDKCLGRTTVKTRLADAFKGVGGSKKQRSKVGRKQSGSEGEDDRQHDSAVITTPTKEKVQSEDTGRCQRCPLICC